MLLTGEIFRGYRPHRIELHFLTDQLIPELRLLLGDDAETEKGEDRDHKKSPERRRRLGMFGAEDRLRQCPRLDVPRRHRWTKAS